MGAVLLQKKDDGKRHPVGYYSATLNEAEQNYDIYDLELLAIVKVLKHWRPLLARSPHKIKVFSDHMNLKYWRDPQKISRRVARKVLDSLSMTSKFTTSKERPMVTQMHCHDAQTMIKEKTTIKTWWYSRTTCLYKQHTWNGSEKANPQPLFRSTT